MFFYSDRQRGLSSSRSGTDLIITFSIIELNILKTMTCWWKSHRGVRVWSSGVLMKIVMGCDPVTAAVAKQLKPLGCEKHVNLTVPLNSLTHPSLKNNLKHNIPKWHTQRFCCFLQIWKKKILSLFILLKQKMKLQFLTELKTSFFFFLKTLQNKVAVPQLTTREWFQEMSKTVVLKFLIDYSGSVGRIDNILMVRLGSLRHF